MKQKIKDALLSYASVSETKYYSEVAPLFGYNLKKTQSREAFNDKLEEIGLEQYLCGKPLLNCLVISKENNKYPSIGFYKWYKKTVDSKFNIYSGKDKYELFKKLSQECFDYYSAVKETVRDLVN